MELVYSINNWVSPYYCGNKSYTSSLNKYSSMLYAEKYNMPKGSWSFRFVDQIPILLSHMDTNKDIDLESLVSDLIKTKVRAVDVKMYRDLIEYSETVQYSDVYIFSIDRDQILEQIIVATQLRKRFPHCSILFGGGGLSHIHCVEELFAYLGLVYCNGGICASVDAVIEGRNPTDCYDVLRETKKHTIPKTNLVQTFLNNEVFFNTSRGCINNCSYCVGPNLGKFDMLPSETVVSFIQECNTRKIKKIRFLDNELNYNPSLFEYFLDDLIDIDNVVKLDMYLMMNCLSKDTIKKMKLANVSFVRLGVDVLDPKLSTDYHRKNAKDISNTLGWFNEYGVHGEMYFIDNMLGTTDEIHKANISYLKTLVQPAIRLVRFEYFVSMGSEHFRKAEDLGINIHYIHDPVSGLRIPTMYSKDISVQQSIKRAYDFHISMNLGQPIERRFIYI